MAEGKYAGLRVGCITRNSTTRQKGNYSELAQDHEFRNYIRREGAIVIPFDEKGISGRDLLKRDRARELLDLIRSSQLDAIGGYCVDRLTRDETMLDAGKIIRDCRATRALIITMERDYRVWLTKDLQDFKAECEKSGDFMLRTRDNFHRGIFTKAEIEPFFMGVPPVGYKTRAVRVRRGGKNARTVWKNVPERDLGQQALMDAVADALDVSLTLSEAVSRLNRSGHLPAGARGAYAGQPVPWQQDRLEYILGHPVYAGLWTYGRHSDKQSDIWDAPAEDGPRRDREYRHEVPELRWWEPERVKRWRAKLLPDDDAPKRRRTEHNRPLRGILACATCGTPLVSCGHNGYQCPIRYNAPAAVRCAAPQTLSQARALRALRSLLLKALKGKRELRKLVREVGDETGPLAELRSKAQLLRDQLDEAAELYYGENAVAKVTAPVARKLAEKEAKLEKLQGEIAAIERERSATASDDAVLEALLNGSLDEFDRWPVERQAEVYRDALADVRVRPGGQGERGTPAVVHWVNLLVEAQAPGATGGGLPRSLAKLGSA